MTKWGCLISCDNGSKQNGTVHEAEMLGAIEKRLYLCNALETQVQNIEY